MSGESEKRAGDHAALAHRLSVSQRVSFGINETYPVPPDLSNCLPILYSVPPCASQRAVTGMVYGTC